MINKKALQTLQQVMIQEKEEGAALAPEIKVYEYRTNLYQTLQKLEKLGAINIQEAPNTSNVDKTYTTTDFGEKLVENTRNAGMIK